MVNGRSIKTRCISCACLTTIAVLFILPISIFASSYQIFPNLAYDNPAASLNTVNKAEVIAGSTEPYIQFCYTGIDGPFNGKTCSRQLDSLPYGRFAVRASPKIVAGIDITHPANADIGFPTDSFIRFSSIDTIFHDTDISPRVSYQINKKLTLGIGFNANYISDAEINFAAPPYGEVNNQGTSWGYGWDIGLSYALRSTTFLNLSYYSKINHGNIEGDSSWGPFTTRDSLNVVLPATYTLNLVQILTPTWLVSATVRYIQWNDETHLAIKNSAFLAGMNLNFPLNYKNAWNEQLVTRYQFNKKWAALGAVGYEGNMAPLAFKYIGLPSDDNWVAGGGLEYDATKSWSGQLFYGHIWTNIPINHIEAIGPAVGQMKYAVDFIDFNLTWKI